MLKHMLGTHYYGDNILQQRHIAHACADRNFCQTKQLHFGEPTHYIWIMKPSTCLLYDKLHKQK